jgi:transposase-like protein
MLRIAADTAWLLGTEPSFYTMESLRACYMSRLEREGWLRSAKQIRIQDLRHAFVSYYSTSLLDHLGCGLRTHSGEDDWLSRLLRKPRTSHHPLRHLLVIQFLGFSVGEFFAEADDLTAIKHAAEVKTRCPNPVCSSHESGRATCRHAGSNVLKCQFCGFTYRPATGGRSRRRVISYGPAWDSELRRLVTDSPMSLREIGRLMEADPKTIQRQARRIGVWREEWTTQEITTPKYHRARATGESTDRHRAIWLQLRREYPQDGTQALRNRAPATYSHLYRYDSNWLGAHRPSRKRQPSRMRRVDWRARDEEVLQNAKTAVEEIMKSPERPIRIVPTTIARRIGQVSLLEQHPDKLPLTASYLASVTESSLDFALRKVRWANAKFAHEGHKPAHWELARRAALRPQQLVALEVLSY